MNKKIWIGLTIAVISLWLGCSLLYLLGSFWLGLAAFVSMGAGVAGGGVVVLVGWDEVTREIKAREAADARR